MTTGEAMLDEHLAAPADAYPLWVHRTVATAAVLPLHDATAAEGLGPSLLAGLADLVIPDDPAGPEPVALDRTDAARMLVTLVAELDRVVSWVRARQAAALAAFARPGVAVPVGDLLALVLSSSTGGPYGARSDEQLRLSDHEAETWSQVSVAGDPAWSAAVEHAATQAAAAELGPLTATAPSTARDRLRTAVRLVDALPAAHCALADGDLDESHATVLVQRTADLDADKLATIAGALLGPDGQRAPSCGRLTVPALRRRIDRTVARLLPGVARRRQQDAHHDRDVWISPLGDGMSRLCADLPTPVAVVARELLDRAATAGTPGDARTAGQRRADAFTDVVLTLAANGSVDLRDPSSSPSGWDGIGHGVTVVVDAAVLTGVDGAVEIEHALSGVTDGLPADLVRALAQSAGRARLALRDGDDAVDVGCWVRRPSPRLTDGVVLRDRVCRFPGCRNPARRADLDHRVPWHRGGPTTAGNLDALCRHHHRLKTHTRWRGVRRPGNTLHWTTPLGAHHDDLPDSAESNSAVPDTAVPDTAVPDTAVPDTAEPPPPF